MTADELARGAALLAAARPDTAQGLTTEGSLIIWLRTHAAELLADAAGRAGRVAARDEAVALLRVAKCPACDGSGAIPHQIGDDEWEAQQCQWCDERTTLLATQVSDSEPQAHPQGQGDLVAALAVLTEFVAIADAEPETLTDDVLYKATMAARKVLQLCDTESVEPMPHPEPGWEKYFPPPTAPPATGSDGGKA